MAFKTVYQALKILQCWEIFNITSYKGNYAAVICTRIPLQSQRIVCANRAKFRSLYLPEAPNSLPMSANTADWVLASSEQRKRVLVPTLMEEIYAG
jgi:Fe2+ or Zn2+ uptake regulation protein